jgi:hypothetical protein
MLILKFLHFLAVRRVGHTQNFFDRNVNFREIFFPVSHYVLKLVRIAKMPDGASRVAGGNQL